MNLNPPTDLSRHEKAHFHKMAMLVVMAVKVHSNQISTPEQDVAYADKVARLILEKRL